MSIMRRVITVDLSKIDLDTDDASGAAGGAPSVPKKKKVKKVAPLKYKGKVLTPLTPEEASSLDKGDTIKYIGPINGGKVVPASASYWQRSATIYGTIKRNPFVLHGKPTLSGTVITIPYYGSTMKCQMSEIALLKRGDRYSIEYNKAQRWVPIVLNRFKLETELLTSRTLKKVDKYLNRLPLHKKMEFFKSLSPEQKAIFDALDKDIAVLIGLKEPAPENNQT